MIYYGNYSKIYGKLYYGVISLIWHNSTPEQIAEELNTDINCGLSEEEANNRLKVFGLNELNHKRKLNVLSYLLNGLKSFVCISLIVVSIINYILAVTINLQNRIDYLLIIVFALVGILAGSFFKYLSDNIIVNATSSNSTNVTVIRDGSEVVIKSNELVPGDIMLIKSGDYIKADGRLIDSYALTCDESMVSEDIAPSEKFHDLLLDDITLLVNRHNMVYSGSAVLNGRGKVLVTETGMSTEAGMHIDIKKQLEETETPISLRLNKIAKTFKTVSIISAIIVFFIGIIANFSNTEVNFAVTVSSSLLFAFCVNFSVCCHLIPSLVTFSRACMVLRLKSKGITVNSKIITEELKDVTVICTDKTGVLTTEDLTVVKAYTCSQMFDLNENRGDDSVAALLRLALICSNFSKDEHKERHTNNIERSIETACIDYAGMSKTDIDGLYPKIAELPFNSDRMLMTTVSAINGNPISITKGAPEVVLNRCNNIDVEQTAEIASLLAKEGLKVISVAIKQLDEIPTNPNSDELENDLTFVGILGIEDNISPKAARVCIDAADYGIKTIMVTGDHIDTAVAISKNADIISDASQAISGEELSAISDEELAKCISNYSVFARITPEDKLRIVAALKANNEKVLITGDSVNDAQALVEADFGCALGSTASDLVKDSADIVIEDNHYSSIIQAIKESSKFYTNIKKALLHIFTISISLLLLSVFSIIIFGVASFKSPSLILYSTIITILPIFAIFIDGAKKVMETSSAGNKLIDFNFLIRSLIPSIILVVMTLIAFGMNLKIDTVSAYSAAFAVLSFGGSAQALCTLSTYTFFSKRFLSQKYSIIICLCTLLFLICLITTPVSSIIYLTGFTSNIFSVSILTFALIVIANEILKFSKKHIL